MNNDITLLFSIQVALSISCATLGNVNVRLF